ncbi:MAG: helix-turn-helix domain-containing protein [Gammaproteobacteria bacterium]|nr:helix-turn-helix domain-containing protein [Gammaproteobacteria bacterium]MBU1775159.1 helix-turn-helix domain-containing protein [Gammaproteobacteria bacterium]
MANVATVLKEEIIRLARKELRTETAGLKKASVQYRSEIAALKRRVVTLEKQLSHLAKATTQSVEVKAESDSETKVRFVAKGFKTLRQRLGLTAEVIGALLGVSAQTIYSWEAEKSKPRQQQMVRIVMLRGMGKREVEAILQNPSK